MKSHGRVVRVNSETDFQKKASEYREHSQKSQSSEEGVAVK